MPHVDESSTITESVIYSFDLIKNLIFNLLNLIIMLQQNLTKNSSLSVKSAEIGRQSLAALHLTPVGKKNKSIPVLKLNFADPESVVTVTNHASHSSHASHASHHSRHR